jgi:hypothetical protein
MNITDALEILGSKALISPDSARALCERIEIDFDEAWIKRWEMQKGEEVAFYRQHGFIPARYGAGEGVDCLELSYKVADILSLRDEKGYLPGHAYSGDGYQAKANARAIADELSRRGVA